MLLFFENKNTDKNKKNLIISGKTKVNVEIADTEEKRIRGLSGREKLKDDDGMLFVYLTPGIYYFWMKDMQFDLDFIWINNRTVVDITRNVSHNNQDTLYFSKIPVNMILEVNAGFVEKNRIKIGNRVNTN